MSEPVEVWCVVGPDGAISISKTQHDAWFQVCGENLIDTVSQGYRCERRLLVKPGETWQDGVEACKNSVSILLREWEENDSWHKVDAGDTLIDIFDTHSPAPSEADRLLRDVIEDLISLQNVCADEYLDELKAKIKRIETYLKERG